ATAATALRVGLPGGRHHADRDLPGAGEPPVSQPRRRLLAERGRPRRPSVGALAEAGQPRPAHPGPERPRGGDPEPVASVVARPRAASAWPPREGRPGGAGRVAVSRQPDTAARRTGRRAADRG